MDRMLMLNAITTGTFGLVAVSLPAKFGWYVYKNEGCI